MILRLLELMARRAAPLIAASVFIGLAVPPLSQALRPFLIPFIVVPMIVALVRIDWRIMMGHARRPLVIAVVCAWSLVASPLLVWGVVQATALPPALATALILMAAAPPIMAAGAFGLILGLDAALMVVVVLATTLAAPFTLPAMALWLLGLEVDIGVVELMGRLVLLIGGVFLGAALARRLAGPGWLARNAAHLDGVSVLSLIAFAIAIMDGVTGVLMARPGYVLTCLAVAFAANLALQAAAAALFLKVGRLGALSIGLMSGNRNMGMVLAVLADRADFDVVVFFAMAQVPMYTLPALLLPLYRRLLRP